MSFDEIAKKKLELEIKQLQTDYLTRQHYAELLALSIARRTGEKVREKYTAPQILNRKKGN